MATRTCCQSAASSSQRDECHGIESENERRCDGTDARSHVSYFADDLVDGAALWRVQAGRDELIREDVFRREKKAKRKAAKIGSGSSKIQSWLPASF